LIFIQLLKENNALHTKKGMEVSYMHSLSQHYMGSGQFIPHWFNLGETALCPGCVAPELVIEREKSLVPVGNQAQIPFSSSP
jgi:hypothetical protein